MSTLKDRLRNYIKAQYPAIAVQTTEETRARGEILAAAKECKRGVVTWTATEGLTEITDEGVKKVDDTQDLGAALAKQLKRTVYIFQDIDTWPFDRDPVMTRQMKDLLEFVPTELSTVVILGSRYRPEPSFENMVTVIDYSLPTPKDLVRIAAGIAEGADKKVKCGEDVVRALGGLSTTEAQNALALSLVETNKFDPEIVYREKVQAVRKSGLLDIVDPDPRGLGAIGGLENLKGWIMKRKRAYTKEAEKFGLPQPKGILLVGVPGCLAGDTIMEYNRGRRVGGRAVTLRDLYLKFNGRPTSTRPWKNLEIPTRLHSLGPDGRVYWNRIVSVTEAGIKQILRLYFSDGSSLRLTPDHPVAVAPGKFMKAISLKVGYTVLARGSMKPVSSGGRDPADRPERVIVNLKYHKYGSLKEVSDCGKVYMYKRVHRSRLVVEASMNNMSYDNFVDCLQTDEARAESLTFLDSRWEVHHLDENTMNDDIGNLIVLSKEEHSRLHGRLENFNVEYTRQVGVTAIKNDGREMTYDVQMEMPGNNFCANGIMVHNTGKSLSAKAIGTALGVPTLKLDMGAMFNSLVGESEARIRDALALAEAMSPCNLWLDEIEKGLAGSSGGGSNDSGVTKRVFGTVISWMQERRRPVFLVATANDVTSLPPEILRKGRFDEIFSVDLPHAIERTEILKIHLSKRKRDPEAFDLADLVDVTENFTGSEIENVIEQALYDAFDKQVELGTEHVHRAAKSTTPLVTTAAERINAIRKWAATRARPASKVMKTTKASGKRKLDI